MNIWLMTSLLTLMSCSSYQKAQPPEDNISQFKSKLQQLEWGCHRRDLFTCSKYIKLLSVLKGPEVAIETADRLCS
jgi:hypothetical protein